MSAGIDDDSADEDGQEDPVLVEWVAEMADRLRAGQALNLQELDSQHPERARMLRELLPAFDLMSELAHASPLESTERAPLPEPTTELGCLGDFRLIREVGRGGMGLVYEARQLSLGRRVALKILPQMLALDSKRLRRFQLEAQAAALLYHPHIVPVHAVGSDRGVHFYAMQFIDGKTLGDLIHELRWSEGIDHEPAEGDEITTELATQLLDDSASPQTQSAGRSDSGIELNRLDRRVAHNQKVARLGRQAADALEHAHQHGVIHRDIKPGNLMIDRKGHLWITDFGLARLLDDPGVTMSNDLLGTIRYMSPEQVLGRPAIVDHRSDVYSLGATLYELLVLQPAFPGADRAEVMRQILEQEPALLRRIDPKIPRDLETIVHKAIDKDPARRYATAGAMAADLNRFLENWTILARRPTVLARAGKWSRRHRPLVTLAAGFLLLAVVGLVVGLSWSNGRLRSYNDRLSQALTLADQNAHEAQRQRGIAQAQLELTRRHRSADDLHRADEALDANQVELAQDILDEIQPAVDGVDPRGFAWHYLWRQANRDYSQLRGHHATVMGATISSRGSKFVTWDLRGDLLLWDFGQLARSEQPRLSRSFLNADLGDVAISPDGRYLSIYKRHPRHPAIEVFDTDTGQPQCRLEGAGPENFSSLAFDDGSRRLAAVFCRPDATAFVRWWDLGAKSLDSNSWVVEQGNVVGWFSPDCRFLAVVRGHQVILHDPWSGAVIRAIAAAPSDRVQPPTFSADGEILAASTQNHIVIWSTQSGRELARCPVAGQPHCVVLSSNGSFLAIMDDTGGVVLYDVARNRQHKLTQRTRRSVHDGWLSFSSDETLLAIGLAFGPGQGEPPEVWETSTAARLSTFRGRNPGTRVVFLPRSRQVLVPGWTQPRVWKPAAPREPDSPAGHNAEAWATAFSPDGMILATGSDDTRERQTIKLWDPRSGRLLAGWKAHTATVTSLAYSPDGRTLASSSLDAGGPSNPNVIVWDAASHERRAVLAGHKGSVRSVAFSPDGRWIATAGDDATVRLWETANNSLHGLLGGHLKRANSVAFSPDGKSLASSSHDATIRLWDLAAAKARAVLQDIGNVNAVAFAPDGSLLASANEEGQIKLWSPATGELVRTIRGETELLRSVAFSADSRSLAAAGKSMTIRFWDVLTGQELLTLKEHNAQINALAFASDDSVLASCSHDGAVRLWRAREPAQPPSERTYEGGKEWSPE